MSRLQRKRSSTPTVTCVACGCLAIVALLVFALWAIQRTRV